MDVVPHERGLSLLEAHCRSLDPSAPTARERLDDVLGPELAQKLVFALSAGAATGRGRAARAALDARAVFAA
jgi:hypothetical protein